MRKTRIFAIILSLSFILSACNEISNTELNDTLTIQSNTEDITYTEYSASDNYGSLGALENATFSVDEMVIYALQDEYTAKQEYAYIVKTFNVERPFTNIIDSEDTHISLLLPLFDIHDIPPIDDDSLEHIVSIYSIEEAFATGVQAEISNISMYNLFLEQENLPEDIREVFIKLRDASKNHLSAFQRNVDKFKI